MRVRELKTFRVITEKLRAHGPNDSIDVESPMVLEDTLTTTGNTALAAVTSTATEFTATAGSAIDPTTMSFVNLNHATVIIAATLAAPAAGHFLVIADTSASGTAAHTVTLTAGTFNGTNAIATFNAPGETLVLYGISATRYVIVENIGAVAFSG